MMLAHSVRPPSAEPAPDAKSFGHPRQGRDAEIGIRPPSRPEAEPAGPARLWAFAAAGPRVQRKVEVGAVDDPAEREAERAAEAVMRMPEEGAAAVQPMDTGGAGMRLRRAPQTNAPTPGDKIEDEKLADHTDKGPVRRKELSSGDDGGLDEAAAHAVGAKGPGRPLSPASRQYFEPRFSADFGGVRLHDDRAAGDSARRLKARAFAYGSDIWFGAGERESDRSLLAHELPHVVQQRRTPAAPAALRRYVHTNTVYLWDVYTAAGSDPAAVTDAQLRTTIEYEDYTRPDLVWKFSDMVAIAALRRSMDLFRTGVRGRGPNYIRSGREARAAAHGISSIFVTELGFTGDHPVVSVPGGLGGAKGAPIDSPDGSSPVWTIGGTNDIVAYTLGTPPTMFAKFSVVPAVAAPVTGVQVRALVGGTVIGQASGLQISGDAIEDAAGGGKVTSIGGGSAIPGAAVGTLEPEIRFQTSTDGGGIWFNSGSAQVRMAFTAATPAPPGGDLREDVLSEGGFMIGLAATPAEGLRRMVKTFVVYEPREVMPPSFPVNDDVMQAFTTPHQCDSQAYLLRYLALSFGIPADVVYFWYGTPTEKWVYRVHSIPTWWGPTFKCDRPAEDRAPAEPHFFFHALVDIGGVLHDAAYDFTGLPGIQENAPGATPQQGSQASFTLATKYYSSFECSH